MDFTIQIPYDQKIKKIQSKIQFSGRNTVTHDINNIYAQWSKLLGAKALTMRLLSGLHAHIVMFMAITSINDKVLLLPEAAGGHMATKSILTRLGLQIKEFPIDFINKKIDVAASQKLIKEFDPKVIFIDRSEGYWTKRLLDAFRKEHADKLVLLGDLLEDNFAVMIFILFFSIFLILSHL